MWKNLFPYAKVFLFVKLFEKIETKPEETSDVNRQIEVNEKAEDARNKTTIQVKMSCPHRREKFGRKFYFRFGPKRQKVHEPSKLIKRNTRPKLFLLLQSHNQVHISSLKGGWKTETGIILRYYFLSLGQIYLNKIVSERL
jgi:hypothetical protein